MPHPIESEFYIGQTVTFALDPDWVGLVTGIHVRMNRVTYSVTWGDKQETAHDAFELRASVTPSVREA